MRKPHAPLGVEQEGKAKVEKTEMQECAWRLRNNEEPSMVLVE